MHSRWNILLQKPYLNTWNCSQATQNYTNLIPPELFPVTTTINLASNPKGHWTHLLTFMCFPYSLPSINIGLKYKTRKNIGIFHIYLCSAPKREVEPLTMPLQSLDLVGRHQAGRQEQASNGRWDEWCEDKGLLCRCLYDR